VFCATPREDVVVSQLSELALVDKPEAQGDLAWRGALVEVEDIVVVGIEVSRRGLRAGAGGDGGEADRAEQCGGCPHLVAGLGIWRCRPARPRAAGCRGVGRSVNGQARSASSWRGSGAVVC